MPTTPIYALPYPAATDPADVPLDMQELCDRLVLVLGGALAATPPASPFDGQLWAYSPTASTVWILRYNAGSGSSYKWEYVGGAPLYATVATQQACPSAGAWVDLATVGPSLTLARGGTYDLEFGAYMANAAVNATITLQVTVYDGAAPSTDVIRFAGQGPVGTVLDTSKATRLLVTAGATVKLQYQCDATPASAFFARRWIRARPTAIA